MYTKANRSDKSATFKKMADIVPRISIPYDQPDQEVFFSKALSQTCFEMQAILFSISFEDK